MLGLAATIHLLNARLAESPAPNAFDPARTRPTSGPRGMKAMQHACLQRRQRDGRRPACRCFPFLAVLICTMGALVPLLLAVTRQARLQAVREAAAKVGATARPT